VAIATGPFAMLSSASVKGAPARMKQPSHSASDTGSGNKAKPSNSSRSERRVSLRKSRQQGQGKNKLTWYGSGAPAVAPDLSVQVSTCGLPMPVGVVNPTMGVMYTQRSKEHVTMPHNAFFLA
jgi:hypothetical protein